MFTKNEILSICLSNLGFLDNYWLNARFRPISSKNYSVKPDLIR